MFERILLPIADDQDFQRQLRYGEEMAASTGAELCVVHVATSSRRRHRFGWSGRRKRHVVTRTLPVHRVLSGRVAETIVGHAQSIDADVILMPTRGRGFVGQMLFGSTTRDVLRIANRPLWVAKPSSVMSGQPVRCKRIVSAVALGAEGGPVLRYAARLADAPGGELLIVHAIPEISEAMLMVDGFDDSREVELSPEAARRRICSMAASLNVPYRVKTIIGDVAEVVRRLARQWRADVVVAGRGRRTDHWQSGANIGDIIARSPCPVIAVSGEARAIRRPAGPVRRLVTIPAPRPSSASVRGVPRLIPV